MPRMNCCRWSMLTAVLACSCAQSSMVCVSGVSCIPSGTADPCRKYVTSCASETSLSTCVTGGDQVDGTACGPGLTCAAGGCVANPYNDVRDGSKWATFDLTMLDPRAKGLRGAAFDGRYVYFVPSDALPLDGLVVRYDTRCDFDCRSQWSVFDLAANVDQRLQGFMGATYDGRYVYFVPDSNVYGVYDGAIARFDTHSSFTAASSWSVFDVSSANPSALGFQGAAFDGRYVYLVPASGIHTTVARFDTQAAFAAAASWAFFDTAGTASTMNFAGAVFDGRFVYLVPGDVNRGVPVRCDTRAGFTDSSSWSAFDLAAVNPAARGFYGGAFDGRYVYFVPWYNGDYSGVVARYDTHSSFLAAASWSTFDVAAVTSTARGFFGAGFDGRYLYLVPGYFSSSEAAVLARFDTQAAFSAPSSWSTFDVTTLTASAKGFYGSVFDGRYLYLVPNGNGSSGTVARFDARTPWLPQLPGWPGSFF